MPEQTGQEIMARSEQSPLVTRALKRLSRQDWLSAWGKLAALTDGIAAADPRFHSIVAALEQCDKAFADDDWLAFRSAAEHVRQVVQEGPHGAG